MYSVVASNKFQKDYKLCKKRGLNLKLIDDLILHLEKHGAVPLKHKPHILSGDYDGIWECHIKPDWLLLWKQDEEIKLISLTRTGTHSDLF